MKSDDPWFIARDGQQHGPLNENEMKLFVDRGHLRATDLIWRQGFPDWRPAFSVFPPKTQPAPPQQATSAPPQTAQSALHKSSPPSSGPQPQIPSAEPNPMASAPGSLEANPTAATSTLSQPEFGAGSPEGEPAYIPESSPRWGKGIASTLVVGLLAGGGMWLYVNGPPDLFATKATEQVPVVKAPKLAAAEPKKAEAPAAKPAGFNIDDRLQKAELWQFLKGQYPSWYASVLKNAGQLDQNDEFERKLSELLISRLIELRRQNADNVLAASQPNLTELAATFLENLKHLAGRGPEPCYTFISKGEASPAVVEAMRDPSASAPIHKQLLATFKASVDGTKTPVKREAPQKSDYQALTGQLAKIGWNKEDIQLFANPKALSQAPPARVCQMVQDWFTAHLSLENSETQERLLHETLRPVVSG